MKVFLLFSVFSFCASISLTAQDVATLSPSTPSTVERISPKKVVKKKVVFMPNEERRASFDGGITQLADFLATHLIYPELGRENGVEGIVLVEFTIAADGSTQHAKVIEGLGLGFDEEALRLVDSMPKWNPAQQGVRIVASKVRMPIAFRL